MRSSLPEGTSPQRVPLPHPSDNPRLAALKKQPREAADYREFIRDGGGALSGVGQRRAEICLTN